MHLIEAIVRPCKVEDIKNALQTLGVRGMTVAEVGGCGGQRVRPERFRGGELVAELIHKVKVEVAVRDEQLDMVLDAIVGAAHTGAIGDGKILVWPLARAVRIRTDERDAEAI